MNRCRWCGRLFESEYEGDEPIEVCSIICSFSLTNYLLMFGHLPPW